MIRARPPGAPRRGRAGALALAGALLGCPEPSGDATPDPAPVAAEPDREAFRRDAHRRAMEVARREALPALRLLQPVAAAGLEDAPLRPPAFGAEARQARRAAVERARRATTDLDVDRLEPEDGLALRAIQLALERAHAEQQRPPWRDGPRAVLDATEPYLDALKARLAAGRCDDGCGVEALGPALTAGFSELGGASPATVAAAREDLIALRSRLETWSEAEPATHPLRDAMPGLGSTLEELDHDLARAQVTLPTAPEVPWSRPLPRAAPEKWSRRPNRWGEARLRRWLDRTEVYGHPPSQSFDAALATLTRLHAMVQRDRARLEPYDPLPRPFDADACAATFAPLATWAEANQPQLQRALDCSIALRWLGPQPGRDPEIVLALLELGLILPTKETTRRQTGRHVALVAGRAAARGQRHVLRIALASGVGRLDAAVQALNEARAALCLAATALWVHGELGPDQDLQGRLGPDNCGDFPPLIASAEGRPRVALRGLALVLLGQGPADAAALDRFWWAPLGLIRDLARPPSPIPIQRQTRVETLTPEPPPAPGAPSSNAEDPPPEKMGR